MVLPLSSSCDRRSDSDAKALGDRRGLSSVLARGKTSTPGIVPQSPSREYLVLKNDFSSSVARGREDL